MKYVAVSDDNKFCQFCPKQSSCQIFLYISSAAYMIFVAHFWLTGHKIGIFLLIWPVSTHS